MAITTRISSGRGASATDTVIVSKCGNDQESSLCPSGTSRLASAAATFTFEEMTALPPPIAARVGLPSIGRTRTRLCSAYEAGQLGRLRHTDASCPSAIRAPPLSRQGRKRFQAYAGDFFASKSEQPGFV